MTGKEKAHTLNQDQCFHCFHCRCCQCRLSCEQTYISVALHDEHIATIALQHNPPPNNQRWKLRERKQDIGEGRVDLP